MTVYLKHVLETITCQVKPRMTLAGDNRAIIRHHPPCANFRPAASFA
jgi:hypothetical protein